MKQTVVTLLCLGLFTVTLSGCGGASRPSLAKLSGTVLLDGKPLEGAEVSFKPVATTKGKDSFQRPSHGTTDSAGKFSLGTYGKGDGIPSGKYKVAIRKRELVGQLPENYNSENPDATPVQYKWVTPRSYSDPESSGLQVEVTSSALTPNVFDLKPNGAQPEIETTGPQAKFNEP